ncbi:hypothetical protein PHYBOEH_003974 [Phytophthora boehmeriae]|uniref:Vesicle transport protein USE1 n=1 Tax=Phytophthora boehmeriae TaxID=109152 RepID=A0A8T1WMY8_9STRA|nr:hypothetical protein PHYBOEH_003974 [Phytophthora boehmeriae]
MALAAKEAIDCRRFLAAWGRFQADKEQHLDANVAAQYQHMALHFQRLVRDNDELKALEAEIAPVLGEIVSLTQDQAQGACSIGRTPRASEIAKLREQQTRVARTRNLPAEPEVEASGDRERPAASEISQIESATAAVKPQERRTDLHEDDFKSMLEVPSAQEEKLSTKAIRKRLGLVDRSGAQASASETVAREEQESIQSDMMSLAKQLKDRTQTINQSLAEDVKILDAVGQSAESNTALLDRENAKLKEQLASSIGLWTSLWLVAMLVVAFIVTYFYMKLFSRRWYTITF